MDTILKLLITIFAIGLAKFGLFINILFCFILKIFTYIS